MNSEENPLPMPLSVLPLKSKTALNVACLHHVTHAI